MVRPCDPRVMRLGDDSSAGRWTKMHQRFGTIAMTSTYGQPPVSTSVGLPNLIVRRRWLWSPAATNPASKRNRPEPPGVRALPMSRDITQWSWGESNPRPPSGCRPRYDRSRDLRLCGCRTAGSVGLKRRPPPGLSPMSAVFPAASGLSRRQPSLLLPGCGGQAPRAITGRWCSRSPGLSGGDSELLIGSCVCAPFKESEQLRSHDSASGPDVETDQPLVKQPDKCTGTPDPPYARGGTDSPHPFGRWHAACPWAMQQPGAPGMPPWSGTASPRWGATSTTSRSSSTRPRDAS